MKRYGKKNGVNCSVVNDFRRNSNHTYAMYCRYMIKFSLQNDDESYLIDEAKDHVVYDLFRNRFVNKDEIDVELRDTDYGDTVNVTCRFTTTSTVYSDDTLHDFLIVALDEVESKFYDLRDYIDVQVCVEDTSTGKQLCDRYRN